MKGRALFGLNYDGLKDVSVVVNYNSYLAEEWFFRLKRPLDWTIFFSFRLNFLLIHCN